MLNTSKIIGFIPTMNPVIARAFYEKTLGLSLISDEPLALVFESNGTMLRVTKVQTFTPGSHTILGWNVRDIRAEIKELMRRGVRFERFETMVQDELAIWTTPTGAKVAWFKDPDGNTLSLTQFPQP